MAERRIFRRRTFRHQVAVGNPLRVTGKDNALTASGFKVTRKDADIMRRLIQPWQARSFSYYDQLGEIKYASQFYSRMLSPLKLYAAEKDDDGDWVETKNQDAIDALDRIQDPGGGRTALLGAYGRLMFLTGECYLFVTRDPETGEENWEMLSTDELRIQGGTYIRYKAPSLIAEEFREAQEEEDQEGAWVAVDDDTAVAYRLWKRHPRWSMLADSTMQGVLDLCEELILLTKAVRARARSRLAGSGILFIDERISPAPLEPVPDEDPDEDPFISELTYAMTQPIVDEGASSQIVPLIVRVPNPGENGKVADLAYHLQITDPTQLYPETGLRTECIHRIAIGLDMPPEILLGLQDSNHWTAWQIDEQTWKGHGQPIAQQLCDDLTSSYFRPFLRDVMGFADAEDYAIAYDPSAIINHPDRTQDAKDLYAARIIGKAAVREAAGFDEEDAMTDDELAEAIGVAVRDASLAWFGDPAPRGGALETAPGVLVSADPAAGGAAVPGAPAPRTPPTEPRQPGGSEESNRAPANPPNSVDSQIGSLVARLLGATDLALLRAREAAGSRIRSHAKKDKELLALLDGVRAGDVAPTLGRPRVVALGVPSDRDLVLGAGELIEDALRLMGITDPSVADALREHVERQAAKTLYDARPSLGMPDSFGAYLTGLVQASLQGS